METTVVVVMAVAAMVVVVVAVETADVEMAVVGTRTAIDETTWYNMTWEERQAIIEARKRARSANNTNVNGNQDAESTIASPPTTINVDNGTAGNNNNNNNRQANTTNQGSQPGTMIRNMML